MHFRDDKDDQLSQLLRFLNTKQLDKNQYSESFFDFLRECLMLSPLERQKPGMLLAHPIFKSHNKAYLKKQ